MLFGVLPILTEILDLVFGRENFLKKQILTVTVHPQMQRLWNRTQITHVGHELFLLGLGLFVF